MPTPAAVIENICMSHRRKKFLAVTHVTKLLKVHEVTELQLYSPAGGAHDRNIPHLFSLIYSFSQYLSSLHHVGTQHLLTAKPYGEY